MRKYIKNEIKIFTDKLKLLEIKSIDDPAVLPVLLRECKNGRDLYRVAFTMLQYTVQAPDHQQVFGDYLDFFPLFAEADLPLDSFLSLRESRNTITLIAELAALWDAPTFADAKKHSGALLSSVVAEMYNDRPSGLFRLEKRIDTHGMPASATGHPTWEEKVIYSNLLKLSLSLSWKILGKESSGVIQEKIRTQRNRECAPVPLFMKQAADFFWHIDAHFPAATLYETALKETDHRNMLSPEDVLDAYLCWGLCEIEENKPEKARRIYLEAVSKYIEPGMSAHTQNKKWTKYAGFIHSNMAYVCGTMADRERDGSQQQHNLRIEAQTHINKALDFDGDNSSAICTCATLHYNCSEFEEAISAYNRYRKHSLSISDRLMAVRSCIEIRLEQLHGISCGNQFTCIIESLYEDLLEYATLYKSAKEIAVPNQDTLQEIECARTILLNYNPTASPYSRDIGICLLKIYMCAINLKHSLRYTPDCLDNPKNGHKKSRIAYYTTLANAKFLLERTLPDEQKTNQSQAEDPNEWHDIPKTPPQARNRLTMMHVSYMNDPNEGHTLLHTLYHTVEDNNRKIKNHLFRNTDASVFCRKLMDEKFIFMKSFTRLIDQLNMWTTYASDRSTGSDSNGCCICIAPETFVMMLDTPQKSTDSKQLEKNQDDFHLYRIAYLSDGQLDVPGDRNHQADNISEIQMLYDNLKALFEELNELLDKENTSSMSHIWAGLSRSLAFIAFLFKDASYSAEKELRLIITRDRDNRQQIQLTEGQPPKLFIMPPHQIFVDQIILGPKLTSQDKWIPYLQYKLADMWESWPASLGEPRTPKVRKSKISYRD